MIDLAYFADRPHSIKYYLRKSKYTFEEVQQAAKEFNDTFDVFCDAITAVENITYEYTIGCQTQNQQRFDRDWLWHLTPQITIDFYIATKAIWKNIDAIQGWSDRHSDTFTVAKWQAAAKKYAAATKKLDKLRGTYLSKVAYVPTNVDQ